MTQLRHSCCVLLSASLIGVPIFAALSQQQATKAQVLRTDSVRKRLDIERSTLTDRKQSYTPGTDFLPLTNVSGVSAPFDADVKRRPAVFGGRIGSPDALHPDAAKGRVVVFLPPLRSDGEPTYELRLVREEIERYDKAAAIIIASLELIPRSLMRRLSSGEWLPDSTDNARPPVYAISRIVMSRMRLSPEISLSYRTSIVSDSATSR